MSLHLAMQPTVADRHARSLPRAYLCLATMLAQVHAQALEVDTVRQRRMVQRSVPMSLTTVRQVVSSVPGLAQDQTSRPQSHVGWVSVEVMIWRLLLHYYQYE